MLVTGYRLDVFANGAVVNTDEFVAVSGGDEETAFSILDAALASGLLEPAEVGYRFRTGRIRERL